MLNAHLPVSGLTATGDRDDDDDIDLCQDYWENRRDKSEFPCRYPATVRLDGVMVCGLHVQFAVQQAIPSQAHGKIEIAAVLDQRENWIRLHTEGE